MNAADTYNAVADDYDQIYTDRRCQAEDEILLERLLPFVDGQDCLDVGCGTGWFADHVAGGAASIAAFDLAPRMAKIHARKHPSAGWYVADMRRRWPASSAAFDAVVSLWCSASYDDPRHFASEAARVLRPGGVVFAMPHAGGADEGDGVRHDAYLPPACYNGTSGWRSWQADEAVVAFSEFFDAVDVAGFHDGRELPLWAPLAAHRWIRRRDRLDDVDSAVFLIVTGRRR